jgi:hypothetical protein
MTAILVIQGVVILLLTVLVAGLLRSHAEILRRLHELGAGDDLTSAHTRTAVPLSPTRRPRALQETPGTAITGMSPQGATVSVALQGSRGYTLLAFLSSGCGTCKTFWAEFATDGHETPRGGVRTVIVTKSAMDDSLSDIRRLAPTDPLTVMSSEAWDDFKVPFTPYFALVDTERGVVVGDGAAAGWQQLVGWSTGRSATAPNSPPCSAPPTIAWSTPRRSCVEPASRRATPCCINARRSRDHDRHRLRRGGVRRTPFQLVTLRRVDAVQHPPAR